MALGTYRTTPGTDVNELALFAGAGGGILGGKLLGWRTVCAVERNAYAAQILAQRQNDGILGPFPIWSDVCSFDGKPWRGIVDVISGGFPCQDISAAGKGVGISGTQSGLWKEMARIICEVQPRFALVENSPMLTSRGLGTVLGDLAEIGYDAQWRCLSAAECGAPHLRDRIWIMAYARSERSLGRRAETRWQARGEAHGYDVETGLVCNADKQRKTSIQRFQSWAQRKFSNAKHGRRQRRNKAIQGWKKTSKTTVSSSWWAVEPELGRVANGVAHRVDRITALGNGQVPRVAAMAWWILHERLSRQ